MPMSPERAKHVVMFSGGVASYVAALRVADVHGTGQLVLLFADTKIEDEDTYRFRDQAARNVGGELVIVSDGRTPWELFRDERFLGNHRLSPCSKILKQRQLDQWIGAHCDPETTTLYSGLDWSEAHRHDRLASRLAGWRVVSPLCEAPYLLKPDMLAIARSRGVEPSRSYAQGFAHDNCGGVCVKAGQGHYATLLRARPERYAAAEREEQSLGDLLGNVSILRDRRSGDPLTLRELRARIQDGQECDLFDIGGCGCAVDEETA
jgi:hypothetical protein